MNKASERYNTKVEIPISIVLETIFSDDNEDVETLCRWAKKYGYVDLVEKSGHKYYQLQKDYTKQSFYIWLSKEERKQYDYENYLLDEIERLNNIINELKKWLKEMLKHNKECLVEEIGKGNQTLDIIAFNRSAYIKVWESVLDKIKELENGRSDK